MKICVVGAGYWGGNHIRTLNDLGFLGGIVEPNNQLLDSFKKKYINIKIFDNLKDSLKEECFAGFVVATPAETHYSLAKEIILNNKHVLVEKPLTLSVEHAKELVSLANERSVNLMVGHLLLFHPAFQKIKSLVEDGVIGNLQYIYSNRLNLGQVRTEENVFWSLAPHDISIFQYLTNSSPVSIRAHGSIILQKGVYDSTITHLKYSNGIEGHIFVSWLHPFKEHRIVVIGSEAMITFQDSDLEKPLKLYSKKFDLERGYPHKIDGPVDLIEYEPKMPLTEELKYFIDHLDKKKINIANGEHAVEVVKILVQASKQL